MLNKTGTKTLETKRLRLRKFTLEDVDAMYNNWASNPETSRMLPWDVHENKDVTNKLLSAWTKEYEDQYSYSWLVELKDTNEPIGSISGVKVCLRDETCEIGYCYGPKYWGNGYATEALRAVIEYLINEVGFRLVEAKYISGNPASGKVMEKAGMKKDVVLRKRIINKATKDINDLIVYSVLKEEL